MGSELNVRYLFALVLVVSHIAQAAPPDAPADSPDTGDEGSVVTTLPAPKPTRVEGYLELRPSWRPDQTSVSFENNAYLGARFSNGWLLAYRQEFQNEITGTTGKGLTMGDGWIEYSAYPALEAGPFSMNVELHGILPVADGSGNLGYLFGLRTFLEASLGGKVGLFSRVMPRANVFQGGVVATEERLRFETQFELGPYLKLFGDRFIIRPLFRYTIGQLEAAGAAPRWAHQFQLVPEVWFRASPQVMVGIGQKSGSLVTEHFVGKERALYTAFKESVWQLIVQVTL
jgi:hypothetical protein